MLIHIKKNKRKFFFIIAISLAFTLLMKKPDGPKLAIQVFVFFWYIEILQTVFLDKELSLSTKILFTLVSGLVGQVMLYFTFGLNKEFWIMVLVLALAIVALPVRKRIQGYFEKKEKDSLVKDS